MVIDGANIPFTPNEVFLAFTGYLARMGEVHAVWAYVAGLAGSLTGHIFSFGLGWKLGRPLFNKYGKFVFIQPRHLRDTERKIKKYGKASPFIIRFIPGLRNIGSLFLGMFRFEPGSFLLLTGAGLVIYHSLFFLLGYVLAERFGALEEWIFPIVVCILATGLCLAVISWYRLKKK